MRYRMIAAGGAAAIHKDYIRIRATFRLSVRAKA